MRLSKQERIAAIVVLVLVILVAGVFIFIKPNIETINATKETLAIKEREYNDAVNKAAKKGQLREDILAAYDKGKNLADMFYPELAAYEADYELHEFLSNSKAKILIEDLQVSAPTTGGLNSNLVAPSEVQYALKDYVNQGSNGVVTDPSLIRQAMIQVALGDPQTIGATTITLTVQAIDPQELLNFADEINRYQKSENGKSIRKAVELSGISIKDEKTIAEYEALAEEILDEAEEAAAKVFKDKTGYTLRGSGNPNMVPGPIVDGEGGAATGDEEADIVEYIYQMKCSITFYSIERMQDPTPTLDEQDAAA